MQTDERGLVYWEPSHMVEIFLSEPDDFLKVRETLTRIGVASRKEKKIYQSCHILHKQGRYFVVHFKELFMLDGKPSNFTKDDLARRNTISILLSDWGLLELKETPTETTTLRQIKIISHRDKKDWNLQPKYSIGNVKKN